MDTKVNKKMRTIMISIGIIIIVTITVIAIILVKHEKEPETEIEIPDIFDYSDSQVDMNNTENAEIKDGLKRATSEKLQEEKLYNDIKIVRAEITATKNRASFIADVKNEWEKEIQGEIINVIFLKKDGSVIATIETYFPDLEAKGEGQITLSTNEDIANAYDYKIERK